MSKFTEILTRLKNLFITQRDRPVILSISGGDARKRRSVATAFSASLSLGQIKSEVVTAVPASLQPNVLYIFTELSPAQHQNIAAHILSVKISKYPAWLIWVLNGFNFLLNSISTTELNKLGFTVA
jgi:hypothetical protein